MLFTWPGTVHPELVEGCVAKPFMLRQAQHERLNPQRPYNCGPISKTLEALSLYEILDFKGRKKYSESIFLRCLFNAAREVMHDGPEL
jgi:hypothetical protein